MNFPSFFQIQSGAQTPFKKWLLNFAVQRKHAEVKQGIIRNNSIWDKLIFHKVQVSLSGLHISKQRKFTFQHWMYWNGNETSRWSWSWMLVCVSGSRNLLGDLCEWWWQVLLPFHLPCSASSEHALVARWNILLSVIISLWMPHKEFYKSATKLKLYT